METRHFVKCGPEQVTVKNKCILNLHLLKQRLLSVPRPWKQGPEQPVSRVRQWLPNKAQAVEHGHLRTIRGS